MDAGHPLAENKKLHPLFLVPHADGIRRFRLCVRSLDRPGLPLSYSFSREALMVQTTEILHCPVVEAFSAGRALNPVSHRPKCAAAGKRWAQMSFLWKI